MNERVGTRSLASIRDDFPGLAQSVHGKPLVYFDNAATAQMCRPALDAVVHYHTFDRANVHRGVHELSQRASASYDGVRKIAARFLGVDDSEEIVYVKGTTEAVNLVAQAWGDVHVKAGDVVVVTEAEHHSNLVPWQLLAQRKGAVLRAIPIDDRGVLDLDVARKLFEGPVKLLALGHVSNALGTVHPVAELAKMAHNVGAVVFVDGAQGAPHIELHMDSLGADFYCFSGHKTVGPTGSGILWGRKALLESMQPYQGGGDMIDRVTLTHATWQPPPMRFEAGTPNIAGMIGLGAALDYLMDVGLSNIGAAEADLLAYAAERVACLRRIKVVGTAPEKAAVLSFVIDGAHPTDVGMWLDANGVAVRTGHHCAQPVMDHFGVSATARASLAFYNTREEVDRFVDALERALNVL